MYYLMRLTRNNRLEQMASVHLRERSEDDRYVELIYQADSWSCARRVILVIQACPGELFDRFNFLVTNPEKEPNSGKVLADLYSKRGKAEYH